MDDFGIHGVDLAIVVAYLAAIPCFGFYFKRYVRTGQDFFLAGRMLPWWVISLSIIGTNIGATDYVGAAGGAYRFGLAQANFEWIGAIPAIVLSALLFVPFYWKTGVYTVPEYLGRRYDAAVRVIQTVVWSAFLVFQLGLLFWASGLMIEEYMGEPLTALVDSIGQSLGIPLRAVEIEETPYLVVGGHNLRLLFVGMLLTAAIVGAYTVLGGLAAVAMTDVVQFLVMFVGGIALTVLGLWSLGGWQGLTAKLAAAQHADHLHLFLPASHHMYPWPAVVLGLALVASPAWWCCNQAMIQRCLGARSPWDAKAGMLFAAFPKMMIPVITTIPGLIVLALGVGIPMDKGDTAYPWLIKSFLPTGLRGLVFAAFVAALISSVDSVLNSLSTLLTKDIYQRYLAPRATDRHYLLVGRVLTAVLALAAIFIAPVTDYFEGIFVAGGTMLAVFQGPTFAVALLGLTWRRANRWGGLIGLVGGLVVSIGLLAVSFRLQAVHNSRQAGIAFFYVVWWSFFGSLLITVIVSLLTRPDPLEKLEGLVYGLVGRDAETQGRLARRANGES